MGSPGRGKMTRCSNSTAFDSGTLGAVAGCAPVVSIVSTDVVSLETVTLIYSASASGAPSLRCGASVFSNMVSALAIAMCMSRYW
ncbi:Uncharacterised protein [Mycobacteroides abscessus subsp. abscessus]|nr:Uncharacterised protein [Mycobacteroides abscessus subsp. abscessus]